MTPVAILCSSCPAQPAGPFFFFSTATASTEIYTLSLHDALPISRPCHWTYAARASSPNARATCGTERRGHPAAEYATDRKSTRLNSSHLGISYAVFCLKKKNTYNQITQTPLLYIQI